MFASPSQVKVVVRECQLPVEAVPGLQGGWGEAQLAELAVVQAGLGIRNQTGGWGEREGAFGFLEEEGRCMPRATEYIYSSVHGLLYPFENYMWGRIVNPIISIFHPKLDALVTAVLGESSLATLVIELRGGKNLIEFFLLTMSFPLTRPES